MCIYTEIPPTYLYIKKHSITGLKYFGKTSKKDPYKYLGSGTRWKRHIKKHGRQFVETLWVSELYYDTSIIDHALHFSNENNIVLSDEWANLVLENGIDGAIKGTKFSDAHKEKMSYLRKGRPGHPHSAETKEKLSIIGKNRAPASIETRAKMSASRQNVSNETRSKLSEVWKGRRHNVETRKKQSDAHKGKIVSPETRAKMSAIWNTREPVICPHCNKSGRNNMTRYHFDNCKKKPI